MEKREPLCMLVGNVNWWSHYEKQYEVSSKKLKNWAINSMWSSNSTSGHLSGGNKITVLHSHAHSSLIHNNHNIEIICPSTEAWIKQCGVYVQWMVFSHKKKIILPFVSTWMDCEGIMLSEIDQRKTNTIWSHLYMNLKKKKKIRIKKKKQPMKSNL